MALSIDALSTGSQASGATLTISHTCAANSVLFVGAGSTKEGANQITGVTWNTSENLIKAVECDGVDATYGSIWYIKNPTSGTHNIVITVTDNTRGCQGLNVSFLGADTTTPLGATTSNSNHPATTQNSKAITTNNANSMVFSFLTLNGTGRTITASGTNQTDRGQVTGESQAAMSTQTTTTAGSYTDTWDFSSGQVNTQSLAEVNAGATTGLTAHRTLQGVGI